MKRIVTLFFLLLLFANCFAVLEYDSVKVFAVTDNGAALTADLTVNMKPGNGDIWIGIQPLVGTSTQSTAKLAVETAKDYSSVVDNYDYFFEIESNASLVEGPSAGAAMTLLVISMLQDKVIPNDIALTGTITANGGIGSVGGVFEKSKEAARIGIKLFMVPPGETRQTVKIDNQVKSVNLIDYAEKNWGLKVVEVNHIDDVLEYAFADIESIDVNAGALAIDFVPKQISIDENLEPMKALTADYISQAEASIRSAKTALSGTMLNEPVLIDTMLTSLNESEKALDKAKILLEQNYLYSAANYAFLAVVNSTFVKDVAENPGLLSASSTAFDNKVNDLDKKISSFSRDLNTFVPVGFFEWHVASKERLVWARLKINGLKETDQIIIIVEEDAIDWQRVSDLMDYEYALAWYNVSKDFYGLTKNSERGVMQDTGLNGLAGSYISNTENGLSILGEGERDDILRRLDASKLSLENGWTYAALFDSSSSLALTNAAIFSRNKTLDELQEALLERASELEQKLSQSNRGFVWAKLYLDHARYFLDSSYFYQEHTQSATALNHAKSGIDLIFLAEGVFDASDASQAYFERLPGNSFVMVSAGWQQKPSYDELIFTLLLLLVLVACVMLFAIIGSGKKFHLFKRFSFDDRFGEILLEQRKLRKRLEKGFLTKGHFDMLNQPLQKKINRLLAERRTLSANYVELDMNKSKVVAFERALRDLKTQLKKKQITADDFAINNSFYKKKISLLKHLIAEEEKKIKFQKKKTAASFSKKNLRKKRAKEA